MAKNSDTLHRVAATFQAGRDPDQDAVIQWLTSLPKNDKGQLHRSALKFHMTRAIIAYITNGQAASPSAASGGALPPVVGRPVAPARPIEVPQHSANGHDEVAIPTLTDAIGPGSGAAHAELPKKSSGGLLRSRIKGSISPSGDGS